jgi:carboxyl-terminal processing protease
MPRFQNILSPLTAGFVTTLLMGGCGGGSGGDDNGAGGNGGPAACSETARKEWVLNVTREWYLYPELLPATVDLTTAATAEALLDALTATARQQGKDRYFSYLTTQAEEESLFGEGEFVGFGFRTRVDSGNRPFLLDVFANSPAADAALQRGDEIIALDAGNGLRPVAELLSGDMTISELLGPAEPGVVRGVQVSRNGTALEPVTLTKRMVTIDPIPDDFGVAILPLAGTTGVGYLHLRSYISPADPQLRAVFAQFRAQNQQLQYFIVDLRYNGGGLLSTAAVVNDLLGGSVAANEVQYRLVHNASKAAQNSTVRFQSEEHTANPVRIAFLTTDSTASASELNINSLDPFVEVAIVGGDTLGKPVGQLAFDLAGCDDRLRLISFKTVNANDRGDYYTGLAASVRYACAAADTLGAPLGSVDDGLISAALAWLGGGQCAPMDPSASARAAMKTQDAASSPYLRPSSDPVKRWLPGTD